MIIYLEVHIVSDGEVTKVVDEKGVEMIGIGEIKIVLKPGKPNEAILYCKDVRVNVKAKATKRSAKRRKLKSPL